MFESLQLIILLLVSSVFLVALFKYLSLPPMIAYFVVGLILGPNALGILPDSESSRHFVEFGIVFLMFTIGLEFSLPKLNSMRNILFGLGGSQVLNYTSCCHNVRCFFWFAITFSIYYWRSTYNVVNSDSF
jgi:CPA2 family monovalent cation:H+ antiporter-2